MARPVALIAVGLLSGWAAIPTAAQQSQLRIYQTKYYTLNTDLDEDGAREAMLRITLMAEEYHERTRDFAGTVSERLPFYLFAERTSYEAAGGRPGTAGLFDGQKLMAVASEANPAATWHAVQHEGFHQFVHATIGGGIPVWANEGLAEYFGEAVWTGDQFVVGLIPSARLGRIKLAIAQKKLMSLREMMLTAPDIWNTDLRAENYDEAWSMVHFLAHADGGRYQNAFTGFLRDVSRRMEWEKAWVKDFGNDVNAFQQRWEQYWTTLPDDPTAELYAEAVARTLTGFYARAVSQRQTFETIDDFLQAATAGTLRAHKEDWLPPSLLADALRRAPQAGQWSLEKRSGKKMLICKTAAGMLLEGTFRLNGSRVKSVDIQVRRQRR